MANKTSYSPSIDYLKLADDYLQTCGRENTKLPKISEFCREYLKKNEDTINLWLEEKDENGLPVKKELFGAIKKVMDVQKEQLMDDGLYGGKEINNAMAIFLLKCNHGMIETERKELVGKDGEPIKITVLTGTGFVPTPEGSAA